MSSQQPGPIDEGIARFVRGPVSALLGTVDATSFPDATRISGLTTLDDRRIRVLIASDAVTARANAVPGARAAVLVTEITSYRSLQLKGSVLEAGSARTAGDLALVDHHVRTFVDSSHLVGIDPVIAHRFFAIDTVPLVIAVEELFDQTPGPGAGRRVEALQ